MALAYFVRRYRLSRWQAEKRCGEIALENIANSEVVRCFDGGEAETRRFREASALAAAEESRVSRSLGLLNAGQRVIFNVGMAGSLWHALRFSRQRTPCPERPLREGLSSVLTVTSLLGQLFLPLNRLGSSFRELGAAVTDLALVDAVVRSAPPPAADAPTPALVVAGGAIRLEDVTFVHGDGDGDCGRGVRGVSLSILPGEKVGIVGPSGGGKSTLLRLLARLLSPQSGRVLIDDQDIARCDLASVRRAIAFVPQENSLFDETVAYNIAYGRPNTTSAIDEPETRAELLRAAALAHLPASALRSGEGLPRRAGERGRGLAGGERQRVAIARCYYKNSPVVLLDEATSSVDLVTERKIFSDFLRNVSGKTVVVVAHRLSTVLGLDRVLFVEDGRLVESGAPRDLLRRPDSKFAKLWRRRASDEQSEKQ